MVAGDNPRPVKIREILRGRRPSEPQPALRLPERAGRAMLGQMHLNGLARGFWDMQQEVNRPRSIGRIFFLPGGGGPLAGAADHRGIS